MKRKFSLVYLTVPDCPPPEMIYLAARAGYDFVSLRTIPMGLPNEPNFSLAKNKELFRQTKTALADTGIKLHDTENARIYDGVDIKSYRSEMEAAAELGARYILSNIWTSRHDFVVEKLTELCGLAKAYELTVIIEFVTWASVKNLTSTLALIRSIPYENIGIVLDILHFHRSLCSLQELEDTPRELLRFVHLCDAPGEVPVTNADLIHTGRAERLYVGEGNIDIAAIVQRLPEMVYGIEVPHLKRIQEMGKEKHIRLCLDTAKDYLGAKGQK